MRNVGAVYRYAARRYGIKAGEQVTDGCFSAARRTYKRRFASARDAERYAAQHGLSVICGANVAQLDIAAQHSRIDGIGRVVLRLRVHYLHKALKARYTVLIRFHKVDKGGYRCDEQPDRNDECGVVAECDAATVEKESAGDEHNDVENIGNKGRSRMELPHSLICLVARGGKAGVSYLEFFLFLLRVAVCLCHANARYRAFDGGIYLGERAAAFAKGADLLFAQQR